ncbi:MAG: choice-of-anchor D domain-containing protein, partial [Acidobacteriaceae bacterium]|nr:choice-of-anchor D domain-containing protein [Acidobacteriaceae bacterium]
MPSFVVDKTGDYKIQLQVTNASSSSTATVVVSTTATLPQANAGPDQLVSTGSTVQLDGSRSVDIDGDALAYAWSFVSVPTGSTAVLSNSTTVNPTFTADVAGAYVVKLTVTDNEGNHVDSTVTISTVSVLPVANAGQQQTVAIGSTVHLDGTKSSDADGDQLSYAWSFTSKPSSSSASLSNANTATPSFVADAAGDYIAQLTVTDSTGNTAATTVRISTQPVLPIATATAPSTQPVGTQVQLDASKSVAFNGSSLAYKWWFVSKPSGSTVALNSSITTKPTFTPDQPGPYVLALTVSDGTQTSAPTTVLILGTSPQISVVPASLSFGAQTIGTTSTSKSIVVTNTGSANLIINSITLGGSNYPEFAVSTPSLPATITPGNTASISATFKPQTGGSKSATITIKDNVTGASPVISMSGTGAVPGISVSPTSIAFAAQVVNTTSSAQPITITNSGTADLIITALTLSGSTSSDFSIDPITLPITVPVGTNVVLGIRSAPKTTGSKSASLTIANNASTSTVVTFTGNGIAPDISISPSSVSFGNVNMGTSSSPSTLTLWNTGTAPLSISNFTISGNNPAEFSTDAPPSLTIQPNTTATIKVTFSPQSAGSKTASLVFSDNTSAGTHQVAMAGVGTLQGISISPPAIDFLSQLVNTTSASISVVVTNTGSTTLTISSVALNGANASEFTFTPPSGSLNVAPQGSVAFPVGFAPATLGKKVASLDITYNGPQSPQSVPLKGSGVAPGFSVSANSLSFGDVAVNTTSSLLVTITNSGTANLSITNFGLSGTNSGEFSFTASPLPMTLSPGSTTTVGVTFKPTSGSGTKSATLSFTDNASGSPHQITLSGNATAPVISVAPAALDLGLSPVTVASAAKQVTISNTGNANLTITSLTVGGLNASEFAISPTSLPAIAPGTSANVNVAFTPASTGARSATLTIVSNGGPAQVVALSGTGALPAISLSPGSLGFGSRPANTPTMLPITVSNPGNASLLITKLEITGTDASLFSVPALTSPMIIAPQGSTTINVTFNPTTGGSKVATLVITNNVGPGTASVALSGSAVAPNISFTPTSLNFNTQPVNTASNQISVSVQNTGTANLVVSAIATSGVNASEFTVSSSAQLPITLTPGTSTFVGVTFKPTSTGVRTASLDFSTNVPGGLQSVGLSGSGTAPAIAISPSSVSFGDQLVNATSSSTSITLTNTGTANLTISSITKSGTNAADFTVSTPFLPTNISPNSSISIAVTLRPSSLGPKSATLTIGDNTTTATHTVDLTGNGVGPAISVAPASLNFNNALVNLTSNPLAVVVTNSGTATLSITGTSLSGNNGFEFALA